jgi:polar amino acid transport system substrate-binding protein
MKRFQILLVVVVIMNFVLVGFGLENGSLAADYLSTVKERGTLMVGTSADYPPYESVDQDGKFVGFDMDLIREIGKRMGLKVEIKDMGFDSLIAAVQAGKIDAVIAAMQATPERDEKVDFSAIYHDIKDAFLVKGDSKITMNSARDAAGYRIAVQTGTIQEKWVQKNLVEPGKIKQDQVFAYERVDNAAMDLAAGRVDILFIISDPAKNLAEKMGLKIALVTSETVAAGQAIAIPDGATTFKAELDRIITELKADGTLNQLMETWNLF